MWEVPLAMNVHLLEVVPDGGALEVAPCRHGLGRLVVPEPRVAGVIRVGQDVNQPGVERNVDGEGWDVVVGTLEPVRPALAATKRILLRLLAPETGPAHEPAAEVGEKPRDPCECFGLYLLHRPLMADAEGADRGVLTLESHGVDLRATPALGGAPRGPTLRAGCGDGQDQPTEGAGGGTGDAKRPQGQKGGAGGEGRRRRGRAGEIRSRVLQEEQVKDNLNLGSV